MHRTSPFTALFLVSLLLPGPNPSRCWAESREDQRFAKIPRDFRVGVAVAMKIEQHFGLAKDEAIQRRVRDLGYQVAAASGQRDITFVFNVLDVSDPNAVALPGGFIYVTKGILELDLTDDELAHILSHECSHVIREHHHRIQKSASLLNMLNMAVLAGAIVASKNSSGSAPATPTMGMDRAQASPSGHAQQIAAAAVLSGVATNLLLLRYIREYEVEADRTGRALASGAGFSPDGSEDMLKKLLSRSYERPGIGIIRTHPYLEERIKIAETQSREMVASPEPRDPLPYRGLVQETLFYRATEFWNIFRGPSAQFLLRNAYSAAPREPLADDCRLQSLSWLEKQQQAKTFRQRDFGYFCHAYEGLLREFPVTDLRPRVERKLRECKKRRDELYSWHLSKLDGEHIIPSFGEYFLRNFPKDPRFVEAKYKLAEAYRLGRKCDESAEQLLDILGRPGTEDYAERVHKSFSLVLPRLTRALPAYQYYAQLPAGPAKEATGESVQSLIRKSESIEDLGRFMETCPDNDFMAEANQRLCTLSRDTLAKARMYRGARNYAAAAFEYYKVTRYSPDRALSALASDELKEMQELN